MTSAPAHSEIRQAIPFSVTSDNRRHIRRVFVADGKLLVSGYGECACTSADVSTHGMAVLVNHSFFPDSECVVAMDVNVGGNRRRINAWGQIVYAHRCAANLFRIGIKFIDMDSYSGLILRETSKLAYK